MNRLPLPTLPTPPSSRPRPKTLPPPLPESASRVPPARAAADADFADHMLGRLAAGDYAGALAAAEALLVHQPLHADALDCAQIARSELRKLYAARLGGSLDRVPHVAVGVEALGALGLDFRAGFVLSRVDGASTVASIVETCGLTDLEVLRILSELFLQRVVAFDPATG